MGFIDSIRNIFTGARKSASRKAYDNLEAGQKLNFSPESDRYTFGNQEDTQYNKKWSPKTSEEKKTLSPEGYFRIGERQDQKEDVFRSIFDAAKAKAKASDEKRVQELKDKGQKARRTNKRTLEKNAKAEAEKIFDEEYHEKQIAIPSTAIKNIKYNPKDEILKVRFQNGKKEYAYRPGVPVELIQRWLKAPSKGEFFMKNIHDQYSLYGKDHRPKTKAEQRGIKKLIKKAERTNKNRGVKAEIRGR